jgi:hypothetical protein
MAKRVYGDINNEVAQAFKLALKIRDHREAQLADDSHCPGVGLCEVCDEYERLVAIVDTALDVRPHQLSPIDVFDSPAPPMREDKEKAGLGPSPRSACDACQGGEDEAGEEGVAHRRMPWAPQRQVGRAALQNPRWL